MQGATFEVTVGEHGDTWTLHSSLFREAMGFFDGALGGEFQESKNGKVTLAETDPQAFGLLVEFVYSRELTRTVENKPIPLVTYIKLWVLADKLLFHNKDLEDHILSRIRSGADKSNATPTFGEFLQWFELLSDNSGDSKTSLIHTAIAKRVVDRIDYHGLEPIVNKDRLGWRAFIHQRPETFTSILLDALDHS